MQYNKPRVGIKQPRRGIAVLPWMTSTSRSTFGLRWCCRFPRAAADEEEGEPAGRALQHKASFRRFGQTLAALESVLTEPFAEDYGAKIKSARAAVIAKLGGAAPKSR